MHVKRLYGRTVRDALAAAREELGPGALVLSTELVPASGWRGWIGQRMVRLTAAAERPGDDSQEAADVSVHRPEVTARRPRRGDAARAGVVARLSAAGLDRDWAESVAARMTEADCRGGSEHALRRALEGELEDLSGVDAEYARYEVFVGPPGVGKTTTIAKIAAHECAAGRQPLGLVAADAFRAGAIEQLRSYAEVIGSPFRVARTSDEFEQALQTTRPATLVDTAGRMPSDQGVAGLFDVLARRRGVRTHVVLAADTSAGTARRLLDRYASLRPSRVVITKLDEADSVTPLVSVVRERGLPVSYLTTGQRVPDDLARATPANLAAALLAESATETLPCH
jgi:flagellar biosynthesis protein FlhF